MQEVVRASGIMKAAQVGRSTAGLIRAPVFRQFLATVMANNPYCFVLRPPDHRSGDLAIDALRKAEMMLRAWAAGPLDLPEKIVWPLGDDDLVRTDCPAFLGYHEAGGRVWPLCRANDRHPELFHYGGVFNEHGKTTCGRCSWHHTSSKLSDRGQ